MSNAIQRGSFSSEMHLRLNEITWLFDSTKWIYIHSRLTPTEERINWRVIGWSLMWLLPSRFKPMHSTLPTRPTLSTVRSSFIGTLKQTNGPLSFQLFWRMETTTNHGINGANLSRNLRLSWLRSWRHLIRPQIGLKWAYKLRKPEMTNSKFRSCHKLLQMWDRIYQHPKCINQRQVRWSKWVS